MEAIKLSAVPAEIPIFSSQSVKAMSSMSQEIAKILDEAGYIEIVEKTDPVRAIP